MPLDTSNQGAYLLSQWLRSFRPAMGSSIRSLLSKNSGQTKIREPLELNFPIRFPSSFSARSDLVLGAPTVGPPPTSVISSYVSSWVTSSLGTSTSSGGTGTSGSFLSTTTSIAGTSGETTGGGGTPGGNTTPGDGSVTTTGGGDTTGSGETTSGDYGSTGSATDAGSTTGGGDTSGSGATTGFSGTIIVDISGGSGGTESSVGYPTSGGSSGAEEGCWDEADPTIGCTGGPLPDEIGPDNGLGCPSIWDEIGYLCGTTIRELCSVYEYENCPDGCDPDTCAGCLQYDYDCCYTDSVTFTKFTFSGCCCRPL